MKLPEELAFVQRDLQSVESIAEAIVRDCAKVCAKERLQYRGGQYASEEAVRRCENAILARYGLTEGSGE